MNTKEYIESGILEAYALHALDEKERAEVAANIAAYPELAEELAAIELSMQQFAEATAEQPPAFMKEQIWETLQKESNTAGQDASESKTVPFSGSASSGQVSWQRAAIWVALIGSLITNFLLWNQKNNVTDQQVALETKVDSLTQQQSKLNELVASYQHEKDMMLDPDMKMVVMRGMTDEDKSTNGTVYWSKGKEEAYLAMNNIPMPPKGKQYQLWIIKDGEPVDMGMISNDMIGKKGMMMKVDRPVSGAQAFAISIENEGGSPTPTQVYVLGATS